MVSAAMMLPRPNPTALRLLSLSPLLLLLGCGHPATRAECEEIFNRSAEFELNLQNVRDAKLVAERTAAVKSQRGEELISQCVGRRVTDKAMACIRQAKNAEELDLCLE